MYLKQEVSQQPPNLPQWGIAACIKQGSHINTTESLILFSGVSHWSPQAVPSTVHRSSRKGTKKDHTSIQLRSATTTRWHCSGAYKHEYDAYKWSNLYTSNIGARPTLTYQTITTQLKFNLKGTNRSSSWGVISSAMKTWHCALHHLKLIRWYETVFCRVAMGLR
jgi:hypothetical protein